MVVTMAQHQLVHLRLELLPKQVIPMVTGITHGTPVMATVYGLDVVAPKRWGKAPDLVLSGPNEGQNVGKVVVHSGTIGNVQFSAGRGIPSIALSADTNTVDDKTLNNPNSAIVAKQTVVLLKLQAKAGKGQLLPKGITLNVNFLKI